MPIDIRELLPPQDVPEALARLGDYSKGYLYYESNGTAVSSDTPIEEILELVHRIARRVLVNTPDAE